MTFGWTTSYASQRKLHFIWRPISHGWLNEGYSPDHRLATGTTCGLLQIYVSQLAQRLSAQSNSCHVWGVWTAKYGKQIVKWRNRQAKRNGVPFMAEHGEKYLQSPADDEHFSSSSICKTCPLLKSHSQKRMESDLNSDLPDSKAWFKKRKFFFYLTIPLSYLMF